MKLSRLTLLLITPLCCWGETNKPVREYKMFNKENGLTTTMLDIGTTSFTFAVEWQLDTEIPTGTLYLFGNRHMEDSWWSWERELVLDQTQMNPYGNGVSRFPVEYDPVQRKAIFEIHYRILSEEYNDFKNAEFAGKGLFHVSAPPLNDTGWLPSPEEIEEELAKIRKEREGGAKVELKMDVERKSNYLWIYAGILIGMLCAVSYFLRRKLETRNWKRCIHASCQNRASQG